LRCPAANNFLFLKSWQGIERANTADSRSSPFSKAKLPRNRPRLFKIVAPHASMGFRDTGGPPLDTSHGRAATFISFFIINLGIKQMTGYPEKKPTGPAKVEQVGPYRNNTAPQAARFGKGATNINEIREATEACRRHNEALSGRYIGPRESGNANSK
jgi:hypothetical protein